MDKTMRCQCGRQRTVALDKNFRTVLLCLECDEVERSDRFRAIAGMSGLGALPQAEAATIRAGRG
jgi:hypothetical protein